MKRITGIMASGLVLALASGPASAGSPVGEFSANMTATSDYVWRGVSQTMEDPAIQGGIDWSHDSGLYAGVWASNVDFGDAADIEMDLYGGFTGEAGGFSYDIGYIYYSYPDDQNGINFSEVYTSVGRDFGIASVTAGLAYGFGYAGGVGKSWYPTLDIEVPLGNTGLSAAGHIGYYSFTNDSDYTEWSLGLTMPFKGLDLSLSWHDTDISGDDQADSRLVFAISRSLDSASRDDKTGGMFPGEFSASLDLTSDYVWRGVSQTMEGPAIQASLDWSHDSGLYVGLWATNVDFGRPGEKASLEIDYYGGYSGEINGIGYDIGYNYYSYPSDQSNSNFGEFYASLSHDIGPASATVGVYWGNNNPGGVGDSWYPYLDIEAPIPLNGPVGLSVAGHIARYSFNNSADYTEWSLGVTASVFSIDMTVAWHDTDLSRADLGGNNDVANGRVVFTLGTGF